MPFEKYTFWILFEIPIKLYAVPYVNKKIAKCGVWKNSRVIYVRRGASTYRRVILNRE